MPWIRLDDNFDQHPKFIHAGPLGIALWVSALAWCNRTQEQHDSMGWDYGYIPAAKVRMLLDFDGIEVTTVRSELFGVSDEVTCLGVAEHLVRCGIFEKAESGYIIHGYDEYQRPEYVAEVREKRRAAGRVGGLRSAEKRTSGEANAQANASANGKQMLKQTGSTSSSKSGQEQLMTGGGRTDVRSLGARDVTKDAINPSDPSMCSSKREANASADAQANGKPDPVPVPYNSSPPKTHFPSEPLGDEEEGWISKEINHRMTLHPPRARQGTEAWDKYRAAIAAQVRSEGRPTINGRVAPPSIGARVREPDEIEAASARAIRLAGYDQDPQEQPPVAISDTFPAEWSDDSQDHNLTVMATVQLFDDYDPNDPF